MPGGSSETQGAARVRASDAEQGTAGEQNISIDGDADLAASHPVIGANPEEHASSSSDQAGQQSGHGQQQRRQIPQQQMYNEQLPFQQYGASQYQRASGHHDLLTPAVGMQQHFGLLQQQAKQSAQPSSSLPHASQYPGSLLQEARQPLPPASSLPLTGPYHGPLSQQAGQPPPPSSSVPHPNQVSYYQQFCSPVAYSHGPTYYSPPQQYSAPQPTQQWYSYYSSGTSNMHYPNVAHGQQYHQRPGVPYPLHTPMPGSRNPGHEFRGTQTDFYSSVMRGTDPNLAARQQLSQSQPHVPNPMSAHHSHHMQRHFPLHTPDRLKHMHSGGYRRMSSRASGPPGNSHDGSMPGAFHANVLPVAGGSANTSRKLSLDRSSKADSRAAPLDASAANAVCQGDDVMLALLITSWAGTLNEVTSHEQGSATYGSTNAPTDARAFESMFACSNALHIVANHVLFYQPASSQVSTPEEVVQSGVAADPGGMQGTDLSSAQKSLVSLFGHVLYGEDSLHEALVRAGAALPREIASDVCEPFSTSVRFLRTLRADIKALSCSDISPMKDVNRAANGHGNDVAASDESIDDLSSSIASNRRVAHKATRSCGPFGDRSFHEACRLHVGKLHSEIAIVALLRKTLIGLSSFLPDMYRAKSSAQNLEKDSADDEGETKLSAPEDELSGIIGNKNGVGRKPDGSPKSGGMDRASWGNGNKVSAKFFEFVYSLIEQHMARDIRTRTEVIQAKHWQSLVYSAVCPMLQSVTESASERLKHFEKRQQNIESSLRLAGFCSSQSANGALSKNSDLLSATKQVEVLLVEHRCAVDQFRCLAGDIRRLLTSVRAVGVASVNASVVPPNEVLQQLYERVKDTFSVLVEGTQWSFKPTYSKVSALLQKSAAPKPRMLRFEEPDVVSLEDSKEPSCAEEAQAATAFYDERLTPVETAKMSKRHKPRHARMKSSPDELLNLQSRLDTSDDDGEAMYVESEFRLSPHGKSDNPASSPRESSSSFGGTNDASLLNEERDAELSAKLQKVQVTPSVVRQLNNFAEGDSSDGDDGMVVHDDDVSSSLSADDAEPEKPLNGAERIQSASVEAMTNGGNRSNARNAHAASHSSTPPEKYSYRRALAGTESSSAHVHLASTAMLPPPLPKDQCRSFAKRAPGNEPGGRESLANSGDTSDRNSVSATAKCGNAKETQDSSKSPAAGKGASSAAGTVHMRSMSVDSIPF